MLQMLAFLCQIFYRAYIAKTALAVCMQWYEMTNTNANLILSGKHMKMWTYSLVPLFLENHITPQQRTAHTAFIYIFMLVNSNNTFQIYLNKSIKGFIQSLQS